jgi:hypothetical protein
MVLVLHPLLDRFLSPASTSKAKHKTKRESRTCTVDEDDDVNDEESPESFLNLVLPVLSRVLSAHGARLSGLLCVWEGRKADIAGQCGGRLFWLDFKAAWDIARRVDVSPDKVMCSAALAMVSIPTVYYYCIVHGGCKNSRTYDEYNKNGSG